MSILVTRHHSRDQSLRGLPIYASVQEPKREAHVLSKVLIRIRGFLMSRRSDKKVPDRTSDIRLGFRWLKTDKSPVVLDDTMLV